MPEHDAEERKLAERVSEVGGTVNIELDHDGRYRGMITWPGGHRFTIWDKIMRGVLDALEREADRVLNTSCHDHKGTSDT